MKLPKRRYFVLGLLAIAAGTFLVARDRSARKFQAALGEIDAQIEKGLAGIARERLMALDTFWSSERAGDIAYRLGLCEQAAGRVPAALEFWAKVPEGHRSFPLASLRRGTVLTNAGRYSEAESALAPFLDDSGRPAVSPEIARELRKAWLRLLRFQGRAEDVRRGLVEGLVSPVESTIGHDPSPALKEIWALDTAAVPIDGLATVLLKAPADDPRVILGRARLAILDGRFSEGRRLLDSIPKSNAGLPPSPIARARLELAKASGDVASAWGALEQIPARSFTASEALSLRAWLCGALALKDREREAWAELLRIEPKRPEALDRSAALALSAVDQEAALAFLDRKAESDTARDKYRKILLNEADLKPFYEDLERFAQSIGRSLDARGWALARALNRPEEPELRRALARLEPGERPASDSPNVSLAEIFKDLRAEAIARNPQANPNQDSPIIFDEEANAAGLRFAFDHGATSLRQLPETMSGGVGVIDYDGDGFLDLYLVQGGPFPPPTEQAAAGSGDRLFRNKGDGTFEDATARAGLPERSQGYGHGVAVGDYDRDGRPDVFVTRFGSYALYRNLGGRFEDATAKAGLGGPRGWPTSAVVVDLDADGDLDLYVCHYMVWDASNPVQCLDDKGRALYCDPSRAPAEHDRLFLNDAGVFRDATSTAGIVDKDGRGLGVLATDVDGDRRADLFVANDGTANFLFLNRSGKTLRFEESASAAGLAANADGGFHAGMGIAGGDVNGDGRTDLFVTNFFGEAATYYQGLGQGFFTDVTTRSGLGPLTRHRLGFGIAVVDADNDERPDLAIANGHVNDNRPYFPYGMTPQILRNVGGVRFSDVSDAAGPAWKIPRIGRALAAGDFDNDGRVDLVVVNQGAPVSYFRNRSKAGRFVDLLLVEGDRDGDLLGATVTIAAGGRTRIVRPFAGGSYQASSDPRMHVGLGDATEIDSIEVEWSDGGKSRWSKLAPGRGYLLRRGAARPEPMPGYR